MFIYSHSCTEGVQFLAKWTATNDQMTSSGVFTFSSYIHINSSANINICPPHHHQQHHQPPNVQCTLSCSLTTGLTSSQSTAVSLMRNTGCTFSPRRASSCPHLPLSWMMTVQQIRRLMAQDAARVRFTWEAAGMGWIKAMSEPKERITQAPCLLIVPLCNQASFIDRLWL